ncbi:MAG: T9SS type A sorting domain-containing protein [Gelidibacter sp.]
MKKTFSLLMLFTVTMSFAQTDLYVTSNATTYIYVDGTAFAASGTNVPLYVTNNINLAGSNSFLYLRNDAQLLQGNASSGNSGVGRLSVFQTSTANTYTYNYWSSPVGFVSNSDNSAPLNNAINNSFRSNANIYYETDPLTASSSIATYTGGYDGSATPLTSLVIADYWIWTYDPGTAYSEWDQVLSTNFVAPGYGFTMKGNPSSNQKYDFRGKPNNGTITASLLPGEQTLVGNPYPSALDAQAFIHDAQNSGLADVTPGSPPAIGITGDLYYWEQAPGATSHVLRNYVGGYATYTISDVGSGSVESFVNATFQTYNDDGSVNNPNAGMGTKVAKRYIPIGQGFMVEGKTGATTVYFKNSHRTFYKQSGVDSYFFRNNAANNENEPEETQYNEYGYNIVPSDFKRFRINVDFDNEATYTRQLLMNFHNSATDGFDYGLEGKSPEGPDSDAYWVLNNVPYNIQAFSFDESLTIPLVVKVTQQQPIRFRIFDIQNFEDSQPIYIHDMETNLYVDLRSQNYDINLPIGNYTNRFEITFTEETLSAPEVTEADFKIFQDNPQAQLTILNPKGLDIKTVKMFDTAGKQIFDAHNLSTEAEYHFTTKTLSEGIYVASITLADNQVISKKVIVKN